MRRQNRTFSVVGHVGPLLRAVAVESEPVMDGGGLDAIVRRLAPWVERWDLVRLDDRSRGEEIAGYVMARALTHCRERELPRRASGLGSPAAPARPSSTTNEGTSGSSWRGRG